MSKKKVELVEPDTIRRAALMWINFIYIQAVRPEEAVDTYNEIMLDSQFVDTYVAQGRRPEWAAAARNARRRLKRRGTPTVAADKYSFMLAAAQLVKCVRNLSDDGLPLFDDREMVRHLRNIDEHWEQASGSSLTAVRESIPDVGPGSLTYTKKEIWFETVSFVDVLRWTREVEVRLRATVETDSTHPLDQSRAQNFPDGSRALWAVLTGRIR